MVVTEVTVKLIPRPQCAQLVMASFADVHSAGDAVAAVIGAGIIPAALEMMDRKATAAVEPFVHAGYDLSAAAILLAESDGTPEEVADQVAEIERVLRAAGATSLRVSRAPRPSGCASGRAARTPFRPPGASRPTTTAWTAPSRASTSGAMLEAIEEMETRYGLRCMNVFHAGDGNLHPVILFDANEPG